MIEGLVKHAQKDNLKMTITLAYWW